ncbi:MAG: hypothetical protein DRJ37_05115 [Thermoprotei archaeon]|nr:MAG: hypothetical protein DRJ37_05115 [Thermoprotei archaeon]
MEDLLILLFVWFVANFIPHIIVAALTGKIYYQLTPIKAIIVETSIMLLNLILPLAILYPSSPQILQIFHNIGWQWKGLLTLRASLVGFTALIIIMISTQRLIGNPLSSPKIQLTPRETLLTVVLLLTLTPIAEETMFRGYIQTTLTQHYGSWIGIIGQALMFGLRHLPMDIYSGLTQRAPLSAWISRIIQLYSCGIILGAARYWADSIWASWIIHEFPIILMLELNIPSYSKHK